MNTGDSPEATSLKETTPLPRQALIAHTSSGLSGPMSAINDQVLLGLILYRPRLHLWLFLGDVLGLWEH